MRIGIITWFTYENYGTKLQAIALQRYLRNNGSDVELVNFEPPENIREKKLTLKIILKRIYRHIHSCFHRKFIRLREHRTVKFKEIISKECKLSRNIKCDIDFINVCNGYDLLLFGSDQIWNPNWYHKYYFADFSEIATRKVAFAPSIGVGALSKIQENNIKKSISTFEEINMREISGAHLISGILGHEINTVVDPTLLLSAKEWKKIAYSEIENKEEDYILCYFLSENVNHYKAISEIALKTNLKVKFIPVGKTYTMKIGTVVNDCGVEDFINLIDNAKYVLTDSFHGLIFSLIFEKQVTVFERFSNTDHSSQNSRIHDLLNQFDIEEILVSYNTNLLMDFKTIDYHRVKPLISLAIEKSEFVLKQAINKS